MHMHNLNLLAVLSRDFRDGWSGLSGIHRHSSRGRGCAKWAMTQTIKAKVQEMQKSAGPAYFGSFVASLVSAFILALFLHELTCKVWDLVLLVGSHVWLGFVATVQLSSVLFMKQSKKLFAINTGYQLVCYFAMGRS